MKTKKIIMLYFLLFCFFNILSAGELKILKYTTFYCDGEDEARDVAIDSSGNIIVVGDFWSSSSANDDYLIIKYDNNLNFISSTTFDSGNYDLALSVAVDGYDNIIVTGYSGDGPNYDILTIKYDKNLNFISSTTYDGGNDDRGYKVAIDSSNNIIVAGQKPTASNYDFIVIKYDNNLNIISSATYDGGSVDFAYGVAVDSSNNIIVTGYSHNGSNGDYLTIKYDSELKTILSSTTYDGGKDDFAYGVAVDSSNNIIVTGYSNNGSWDDFFTIKYDNNLNIISSATYSSGGQSFYAYDVAVDNLGNIIVTGNSYYDYFTIKYDNNLKNIISIAQYDYDGENDQPYSVAVDSSDNIIVTGYTVDNSNNCYYLTIKYSGTPEIDYVYPNAIIQGETLDLFVDGANIHPDCEVNLGEGIVVNSKSWDNEYQELVLNITVSQNASLGFRNITITNPDGKKTTKQNVIYVKQKVEKITQLILISSTTTDGPEDNAYDVAVDSSGNVFVVGVKNFNYYTLKYDNYLNLISTAEYDSPSSYYCDDWPSAVVVDKDGNVIVTGYIYQSSNQGYNRDHFTIKYDNNLNVISSAAYNSGSADWACDVAVDNSGNIIVTGYSQFSGSDNDWVTIKYDADLKTVLSSATYSKNEDDQAYGVGVDKLGNIIVTGPSRIGEDYDYLTIKYDSNLNLISSSTYSGGSTDKSYDLVIDNSNNIIVTGYSDTPSYKKDWVTIKYDNNFNILSYARYKGSTNDYVKAVAVDYLGNIIVVGRSGADYKDYLTLKYDNNLNLISSATFTGYGDVDVNGVAVDGYGNIFVVGRCGPNGGHKMVILKYLGSPVINSVSKTTALQGETFDLSVEGVCFHKDSEVSFSGEGITINSKNFIDETKINLNITISKNAQTGFRSITITNPNGDTYTKQNVLKIESISTEEEQQQPETTKQVIVDPSQEKIIILKAETGDIEIKIPKETFSEQVVVTISVIQPPASDRQTIKTTNIGIEITTDKNLQPTKEITITVYYRDSDISGLEEEKLSLARYDETYNRWITIPSVVYTDENKIVGTIKHLSRFGLVQLSATNDLSSLKTYPNPYNPIRHTNGLVIEGLTPQAKIKIYTITGELVKEVEYNTANGIATWDGKNTKGSIVSSGVYVIYIEGSNGEKKKLKLAVEK